jgi:NADPH2:quinone reductase
MRAMRAEGFRGYGDLKPADIPKPQVSEGRVLVRIKAAGVTPLDHTILSGGQSCREFPHVRDLLQVGRCSPSSSTRSG